MKKSIKVGDYVIAQVVDSRRVWEGTVVKIEPQSDSATMYTIETETKLKLLFFENEIRTR